MPKRSEEVSSWFQQGNPQTILTADFADFADKRKSTPDDPRHSRNPRLNWLGKLDLLTTSFGIQGLSPVSAMLLHPRPRLLGKIPLETREQRLLVRGHDIY